MYGISKDGRLKTGSDLDYYGIGVNLRLAAPTGQTYESVTSAGNDTFVVNAKEALLLATEHPTSVTQQRIIARIMNKIAASGRTKVYIETNDDHVRAVIMDNLNTHNNTPIDVYGNEMALKNRILTSLVDVSSGVQNNLIQQVAVDEVTAEPKNLAKASPSGKSDDKLTPDNPWAKFEMQIQNGVGKQDVGISAVSMKAYFALCTTINRYVYDACQFVQNNNNLEDINIYLGSFLEHIIGENFFEGGICTVSGINLDPLIAELKKKGITTIDVADTSLERSIPDGNIINFLQALQTNANKISAADAISAFISMSADNAKDLALAKLNATPELIDIYTYLSTIGTPVARIVEYMSSDAFNFLNKLGEKCIFDPVTLGRDTKSVIK